jgi:hypothetical protein
MRSPQWILGLRHGQKPPKTNGDESKGLSPGGCQRAQLLAIALGPNGKLAPDGRAPSHICVPRYFADPGPDGARIDTTTGSRSYLTMEPLIERLNSDGQENVKLVTCERDDVGGLVERVLECGPVVVICWEHDALGAWPQRFAGKVVVRTSQKRWLPCSWDGDEFSKLWRMRLVEPTNDRSALEYEFSVADQQLDVARSSL